MPKRQRENFKTSKKKAVSYVKGGPIILSANFLASHAMRDWPQILKVMKCKYNQDFSPQKGYHLELKESKELPRQEKAKGVYHHQTSTTRNIEDTSLRRRNI